MGKQVVNEVEEIKVEEQQVKQPETTEVAAKKKGFFSGLGTGMKIVLGVTVTVVTVVAAKVITGLLGGKNEAEETENETQEDSEPAEA